MTGTIALQPADSVEIRTMMDNASDLLLRGDEREPKDETTSRRDADCSVDRRQRRKDQDETRN